MPRVRPFAAFTAAYNLRYAAIAQAPAYDAAIFHTIILHIVGSLNHPRDGAAARYPFVVRSSSVIVHGDS